MSCYPALRHRVCCPTEAPAAEAAHYVGHAAGGGLHPEPAALPPAAPGRQGSARARASGRRGEQVGIDRRRVGGG